MNITKLIKSTRGFKYFRKVCYMLLWVYYRSKNKIKEWKARERRLSGGKLNPEKQFFIIRRVYGINNGIFSDFFVFLPCLLEAEQREKIPVIDMQNYANPYLNDEEIGKINAWDYFYEQPGGIDLDEALNSKNVILCGLDKRVIEDVFHQNNEIGLWHEVYSRYIRLNQTMVKKVEDEYNRLFQIIVKENKKILGVKFRGSDYVALRPAEHSVQPTIEQMIYETEKFMILCGCEYIFIAVEEEKAKEAFIQHFRDKVLFNEAELLKEDYTSYMGKGMAQIAAKNGRYKSGESYIICIELLSRCNSLLASGTSGTKMAMIMNGGQYEHVKLIDLGKY